MELAGDSAAPQAAQIASRRRRWIKPLALVLATAVVAAGWWDYSARRQKRAAEAVLALDGRVGYADELPFQGPNPAVRWLRDQLGHDYTSSVALVKFGGKAIRDEDLTCLQGLPRLQALWLHDTAIGDAGVKAFSGNSALEELSLRTTRVTDAGLADLAGLRRLEFLYLQDNGISDAGLLHLEGLTALKLLKLDGTRVTSQGVEKLQRALPRTRISP